MLKETVERIGATSKVSAVRPLGFLDSLTDRSKTKKKRMQNHSQDKEKSKDKACNIGDDHIDCNI